MESVRSSHLTVLVLGVLSISIDPKPRYRSLVTILVISRNRLPWDSIESTQIFNGALKAFIFVLNDGDFSNHRLRCTELNLAKIS